MDIRKRRAALRRASRVERAAMYLVRYGLAGIVGMSGVSKFRDYEVEALKPIFENSSLFSWLNKRIGAQGMARLIGVTELAIATLLTVAPRRSRLSAIGSMLAICEFTTTLSFLFSTPGTLTRPAGGLPRLSDLGEFLVKDVVLLGASAVTLGEALHEGALHSS
jgi:uncharacterized membrane protein YkgB